MAAIDPAVKPFKDRGGKIIIYQGWMDPSVLAQPVVAYYEEVEKVMGGALYKHFYPGGQGERVEKRDSRKANGGMALGRHALPGWEWAFLEEQARQGAGFAEILHLLIEVRESFSLTCISHFFILNWLKKRLVINASTYFRRIGEHLT